MTQLTTSEGVQEGRGHVTGLIEGPGFRKDSPRFKVPPSTLSPAVTNDGSNVQAQGF